MGSRHTVFFANIPGAFFRSVPFVIKNWRVARARLCRFYDEAINPSLPYVQRSHGNSDSRTGEKCSIYSWTVHEVRLRLSVGYHSIVGDLRQSLPMAPKAGIIGNESGLQHYA